MPWSWFVVVLLGDGVGVVGVKWSGGDASDIFCLSGVRNVGD
jgi:hypothetical protein